MSTGELFGGLVLVTGGAGFIGSHTVDLLLDRGYQVRILDNLQPRVHPNGKPAWVPTEAEFIEGDVSNRLDLARALTGVSAVFHLAAYQDYLTDFSTFIHTNTESAALLFELIVEDSKRFPVQKIVFASSQSVCGEGRYLCLGAQAHSQGINSDRVLSSLPDPLPGDAHGVICPGPRSLAQLKRGDWELHCPFCQLSMKPFVIDEATASPHTTYAISKFAIELLAERLGRRYGIPTVSMRYTYVQGPRNSFYNAYSGIARRFAMRILQELPPIIYEDGQQLRDYINVRDVARANLIVLEKPEADFQVFNVGGGRAITVNEFARMMLSAFDSDLDPVINADFRMGDTRHTVSDISKLQKLAWKPAIPIEQNIAEYVAWIQQQKVSSEYVLEAERVMKEQGVIQTSQLA